MLKIKYTNTTNYIEIIFKNIDDKINNEYCIYQFEQYTSESRRNY